MTTLARALLIERFGLTDTERERRQQAITNPIHRSRRPSMTINPEALEIAARAYRTIPGGPDDWDDLDEIFRDAWRGDMRIVLNALAAAGWLRDTPEVTR